MIVKRGNALVFRYFVIVKNVQPSAKSVKQHLFHLIIRKIWDLDKENMTQNEER